MAETILDYGPPRQPLGRSAKDRADLDVLLNGTPYKTYYRMPYLDLGQGDDMNVSYGEHALPPDRIPLPSAPRSDLFPASETWTKTWSLDA